MLQIGLQNIKAKHPTPLNTAKRLKNSVRKLRIDATLRIFKIQQLLKILMKSKGKQNYRSSLIKLATVFSIKLCPIKNNKNHSSNYRNSKQSKNYNQ